MDVRLGALGSPLGPIVPTTSPSADRRARRHSDRAEMDERDRVPVGGADREAPPLVRQLADERRDAGRSATNIGTRSARRCRSRGAGRPRTDRPRRRNGRSTGPSTGQAQADAPGAQRERGDQAVRRGLLPVLKTMRARRYRADLLLSNRLQRGVVEPVPRPTGQPRHDVRRLPATRSGLHELRDGLARVVVLPAPRAHRADHERDLALRRLRRTAPPPLPPCRERPPRTASSAPGRPRPAARASPPRASAGSPAAAAATRTRPPDAASARAPPTAPSRLSLRAADTRRTGTARRRARSRRARSRPRRPRQHRHRHAGVERRRDQPRAGIADAREPGVARQRDPLAGLEPRQHWAVRSASLCSW